MIKKINKYLLLHYPQLWNTRIVWMLSALVLAHLAFFGAGVDHFNDYYTLHRYYGFSYVVEDSLNVIFSVLVSSLLFIVWLVYYLRNNPFKSYYPLPRFYFLKEFAIQFVIIMAGIMFYASYANGFYGAIRAKTKDVNIVEEINTMNLAYALIPQNATDYNRYASCENQDYIDSLNAVRSELYSKKQPNGMEQEVMDSVVSNLNQLRQSDYAFNYLNFCTKYYIGLENDSTYSAKEISAMLRKWLLTTDTVAMQQVLTRFEAMCKRYQIGYNINIKSYATRPFQKQGFMLSSQDFMHDQYTNGNSEAMSYEHIEFSDLTATLETIDRVRQNHMDMDFWLINAYIALGLALLLFTFRTTSMRVWLTAIIGGGVICIVLALCAVGISSTAGNLLMLIFIVLLFYLLHILAKSEKRKILAGVNLVWFTWCLPYVGLLIWAYLCEIHRPYYYDNIQRDAIYDFLTDQHAWIFAANFVLSFLLVGLLVAKNFKTWMAMEEE